MSKRPKNAQRRDVEFAKAKLFGKTTCAGCQHYIEVVLSTDEESVYGFTKNKHISHCAKRKHGEFDNHRCREYKGKLVNLEAYAGPQIRVDRTDPVGKLWITHIEPGVSENSLRVALRATKRIYAGKPIVISSKDD